MIITWMLFLNLNTLLKIYLVMHSFRYYTSITSYNLISLLKINVLLYIYILHAFSPFFYHCFYMYLVQVYEVVFSNNVLVKALLEYSV